MTGAKLASCHVVRVLQAADVLAPCFHRVQDKLSVVVVGAGDQQTTRVFDQLPAVHAESGVFYEGDCGSESRVAYAHALVAEKGMNRGKQCLP